MRRNRGMAAAIAAIAVTPVPATGVSIRFAMSETKLRAKAVKQTGIAEANAAEIKARRRAEAISTFVIRALDTSDLMQTRKKAATIPR